MTISNTLFRHAAALATSAVIVSSSAQALACEYAEGTSDTVLYNTFTTPVMFSAKDFVMRQASDFNILESSWGDRGLHSFDDPKFEYTKHWLSSYLIANGADFEHLAKGVDSHGKEFTLFIDSAFHSAQDYYTMAKGEATGGQLLSGPCGRGGSCRTPNWHNDFVSLLGHSVPNLLGQYVFSDHPPVAAALFWPLALFPESTESVTTYCLVYDVLNAVDSPAGGGPPITVYLENSQNIFSTPAERAGTLVHEGMHAHYREVDALDHVNCLTGARDPVGACDHFYPHPKDYAGGDLNLASASTRKLPAYELEYEYLCDLLDEGKDWVPLAVLSDADADAGRLANNVFVDAAGNGTPPPFSCSLPSPMMGTPTLACSRGTCDAKTHCTQGVEGCFGGCCVVIK